MRTNQRLFSRKLKEIFEHSSVPLMIIMFISTSFSPLMLGAMAISGIISLAYNYNRPWVSDPIVAVGLPDNFLGLPIPDTIKHMLSGAVTLLGIILAASAFITFFLFPPMYYLTMLQLINYGAFNAFFHAVHLAFPIVPFALLGVSIALSAISHISKACGLSENAWGPLIIPNTILRFLQGSNGVGGLWLGKFLAAGISAVFIMKPAIHMLLIHGVISAAATSSLNLLLFGAPVWMLGIGCVLSGVSHILKACNVCECVKTICSLKGSGVVC